MRRLFRSFDDQKLRYLLISGQASILYGAATFSEDVDIWIAPDESNARRLLRALARVRASVYKLTPRLTRRNLDLGHGFHFLVPSGSLPIYLDVMGRPPRVGPFAEAAGRARKIRAEWGLVPVVCPEDLIKLKLTKRLSDYEVISNLVRIQVRSLPNVPATRKAGLRLAVRSTFNAEDRAEWSREIGRPESVNASRRAIGLRMEKHQAKDTAYWRKIISDLRRQFRGGMLIPRGTPVRDLVRVTGTIA